MVAYGHSDLNCARLTFHGGHRSGSERWTSLTLVQRNGLVFDRSSAGRPTFAVFGAGRLHFPPPSAHPSRPVAIPTTGPPRRIPAAEPSKLASPKLNTPPFAEASQYPFPSGVAAMATTGPPRRIPAAEP